jgi:hypothetical protein
MTIREFIDKIGALHLRFIYRIHEEHDYLTDGTQSDYLRLEIEESTRWRAVADLEQDDGIVTICDPYRDTLWSEIAPIMAIWNEEGAA